MVDLGSLHSLLSPNTALLGRIGLDETSVHRQVVPRTSPAFRQPATKLSVALNQKDTFPVLNQDRTPINHNGLAGAETFLHQE